MLISLCLCAQVVLKDPTSSDILCDSLIPVASIQLYRPVLDELWSDDTGWELERLAVGGVPFISYAATCEPTRNLTKTVDTANYTPQHVEENCNCEFLIPPRDEIVSFIESSKVPVIVFADGNITAQDSTTFPYIAISHVWADGMGSTTEQGLPKCLVSRLSSLVNKFGLGGAFWMDSLCIPSAEIPRKKAIRMMAATYEHARKVLVIDGGIRTQCTISSPPEEYLLRIATSGWMQRVWTLQEGMLARELVFEVQGGFIDCTRFNGAPYGIAQNTIALLKYRPRGETPRTFAPICHTTPRCTYNDLIPLLRQRTTSKPQDEPVAVAGVLGLDANKLVEIKDGEGRMRELIIQCQVLPRAVAVFGWQARRLCLPNFMWAPVSIGQILWGADGIDRFTAHATPEGLHARYTIIRFPYPVDVQRYERVLLPTVVSADFTSSDSDTGPFSLYLSRPDNPSQLMARSERHTSGVDIQFSPFEFNYHRRDYYKTQRLSIVNAVIFVRPGFPIASQEEALAGVYVPAWDTSCHEQGHLPDGRKRQIDGVPFWSEKDPLMCNFAGVGKMIVDPPSSGGQRGVKGGDMTIKLNGSTLYSLVPVLLR